jgi:RimJ/RimL family protein N-acetyltransferase
MLGEVALDGLDARHGVAAVTYWTLPQARGRGLARTATAAVLRFAFGGLGLARVGCSWAEPNTASAAVAAACGFRVEGRLRGAWQLPDGRCDVIVAGRLAADR